VTRVACFCCLALAACTQRDELTPAIRGVALAGKVPEPLPVPLCDVAVAPQSIVVFGDNFVPDVVDVTGPQPVVRNPSVALVSASRTLPIAQAVLIDSGTIGVPVGPFGAQGDGAYSIQVTDADGQRSASLGNALQILPPSTVSSFSPPSGCWTSPTTFVFQGGPFTRKARVFFSSAQQPSPSTVVDPGHLVVNFPAFPGASIMAFNVSIEDPPGCLTTVSIPGACP